MNDIIDPRVQAAIETDPTLEQEADAFDRLLSDPRVQAAVEADVTLQRGLDALDQLLFKEGSKSWAQVAAPHIERVLRIVNDRTQPGRPSRPDEESPGTGPLAEAENAFRKIDVEPEYLTQFAIFYTQRISCRLPGGPTGFTLEE